MGGKQCAKAEVDDERHTARGGKFWISVNDVMHEGGKYQESMKKEEEVKTWKASRFPPWSFEYLELGVNHNSNSSDDTSTMMMIP